jgi:threonine dehydratase
MPNNSPGVKLEAVKGYGANITLCEPTSEARQTTLEKISEKTGAEVIHPFNNPNVIAGQGTAALEMIEDLGNLDAIIAPIGPPRTQPSPPKRIFLPTLIISSD